MASSEILDSVKSISITWTVASLAAAYFIFQVLKSIYVAFFGPLSKIPGPKIRAFSIIPHALTVGKGEHHRDVAELHRKYGPIVRVGPSHVLFAGGQQAWKDIYGFRKGGVVPKDKEFYGLTPNGAHSVATAGDADHTRQRRILSHAFSDRALKDQEPLIKTWSAKLSEKLNERAESGARTDMLKYYNCTTFDIMGDLTFGEGLNMLDDSEYTPWVKTIFDGIKFATFLRAFKFLGSWAQYLADDVLFKMESVQKRRLAHWQYSSDRVDKRLARKTERPDLWTIILAKQDKEQGGMSVKEHHSNGNVFMIAGTETTATALSGTTHMLLQNPDKLAKLTHEIRSAFRSPDELNLESLARLKYVQATLQEGLRLYPPVPIDLPREVGKGGAVIDGHFIPEGTKIGVNQFATYRSEQHFTKATEFHPERWLGDPEFKDDHLSAVEPFSIGPRNCLGKNLAWHEMRILLATVLLQFDLKLLPESNDWNDQKVYILWEKKPLWCTLSKAKA